MKLSPAGLEFLKRAEGFRSELYPDADGWAIGYGCQVSPTAWLGRRLSETDAEALLLARLREFEVAVNESVKVPLKQNQFDALTLLAFNIGANAFRTSTLVDRLNKLEFAAAANEFPRWKYSKKKLSTALLARRQKEREMFLNGTVEV